MSRPKNKQAPAPPVSAAPAAPGSLPPVEGTPPVSAAPAAPGSLPPVEGTPPMPPVKQKGELMVKEFYRVKKTSAPIPLKHGTSAEPGAIFEAKNLLCYPESLNSLLELPEGKERIEDVEDGK